jgi:hypothetical protein
MVKSPVTEAANSETSLVITFVNVTVLAMLVVPTNWLEKFTTAGDIATGDVPVPVRETDCGLFGALSVIINVAEMIPRTYG